MNISSFDPLSREYTIRPQSFFKIAHAEQPLFFHEPFQAWFAFGYDDTKFLCSDPRLSRSMAAISGGAYTAEAKDRWPLTSFVNTESGLVNQQNHRSMRMILAPDFKPGMLAKIADTVAEVVAENCKPIQSEVAFDAISLFHLIPITVISRLLGIPKSSQDEVIFSKAAPFFIKSSNPLLSPEERDEVEAETKIMFDMLRGFVDARRAHPQNDMITQVLEKTDELEFCSELEILTSLSGLVSAGTDTTRHSTSLALRTLLAQPDKLAKLRANPDNPDGAVMELLRFENASKFTMRYSHEEVAIGGQVIPPGQMVFISLHGANWDTAAYKDPDVLDFNRDTRKSTVFGSGEYYCLGAHLAKLQMKTVLRYLLDHLPITATFDEKTIEWQTDDLVMRTLTKFPVTC